MDLNSTIPVAIAAAFFLEEVMNLSSSIVIGQINVVIVAPLAKSICSFVSLVKRIWASNPFVISLQNAQTDFSTRIWTILVPVRLKKEKKGLNHVRLRFSFSFFVPIRVRLR